MNQVFFTVFENIFADTKWEGSVSIDDFVALLQDTNAPEKKELPWLKLARFGNERTEIGCFRTDKNVEAISGIELDYDGEMVDGQRLDFDKAVEILRLAGVACVVSTSPSHELEMPKFRILCFTSKLLAAGTRGDLKAIRAALADRVNGLFPGYTFDGVSWNLSHSYYFGYVAGREEFHRVVSLDGTPIDLCLELDATRRGKPGNVSRKDNKNNPSYSPGNFGGLEEVNLNLDHLRRQNPDWCFLKVQGLSPYLSKVVGYELADIYASGEGRRNNTIFKAAAILGKFVLGGELEKEKVEGYLLSVGLATKLDEDRVRYQIKRGFDKAEKDNKPRKDLGRRKELEKLEISGLATLARNKPPVPPGKRLCLRGYMPDKKVFLRSFGKPDY